MSGDSSEMVGDRIPVRYQFPAKLSAPAVWETGTPRSRCVLVGPGWVGVEGGDRTWDGIPTMPSVEF